MTRKALYTGSFDPMTNGHLDIITRASKMFDELVVGVIVNPNKHPLFSREERVSMIEDVTSHLSNVRVDSFEGLDEGIESIFLMTSPKYSFISSSMIKEVVSLNGCVDGLVPQIILQKIKEKYIK